MSHGGGMEAFMKIKELFISICTALCFCTTGYATEITSVSFDGNELTITGKGDEKHAILKIIPENSEDNIDNIVVLKGIETSADGKITVSAIMPEVSGDYSMVLKSGATDTKKFKYANNIDRQNLIDKLNADGTDIFALFEEESSSVILNNFGVNVELYNSFPEEQKKECVNLFSENGEISAENIKEKINTAINLAAVNNGIKITQCLSDLGLEFENVKYESVSDTQLRAWIEKLIAANVKYQSLEDMKNEYKTSNILYLINTAKYNEYDNLFIKYDSDIKMTEENCYKLAKQMSTAGQSKVNELLKNALSASPAESIAALKNVYQNAQQAAAVAQNGNTGGGGTSGGSSSGNKSSAAGGVPTNGNVTGKKDEYIALNDINDAKWAADEINFLNKKKIISGYEDNTFRPNNAITREEFVTVIINAVGIVPIENLENHFEDVKKDAWYEKFVITAVNQGYVSGIGETVFGTGENISRQDAAAIVYRVIKDIEREKTREYSEFADAGTISDYAKEAVKCMYEYSIINGSDGNMFNPKNNLTRAEAAKMIYNALFWREAR